jgi:4-amino-4-deoxy-L-arabinose transferase-like glycosyltransferase
LIVRKYIFGTLVVALIGLNTALFFWRRSQVSRSTVADSSDSASRSDMPLPIVPTQPAWPEPASSAVVNLSDAPPLIVPPQSAQPEPAASSLLPIASTTPAATTSRYAALRARVKSLDSVLFIGALVVFALTRFIGLQDFPIYFFTDEAIQTVQAASLINNGLHDLNGQFLPTYFQNGGYFNLSFSVYAQALPYWLFGYSIFVTRGASVLFALSGAAAVGLILKDFFKARWWWAGTLLLSVTPTFFLHSRTAFETVIGTSLYAWALYFYLRYRYLDPRSLPLVFLFAALSFYTYSPAQVVVGATALLLLMSDARYHWRTLRQRPRFMAVSIVFLVALTVPYLNFQSQRPTESYYHLRILDSYLLQPDLTIGEKLQTFVDEYTYGLSPAYWYLPNTRDLIRHTMKGYGHIFLATLPFMLIGLAICLKHWRSSAHRALLIALLVAPLGSALVGIQVYRALTFVVPAALITTLGLVKILELLLKRLQYRTIALGLFTGLAAVNFLMLYDALNNGPRWYDDYHIGGLQYGGKEVFGAVRDYLQQAPADQVLVSPTWANGTNILMFYFLPNEPRVQMGNIDAYRDNPLDLPDSLMFVMTPDEYQRAQSDAKFTNIREVRPPLKYPDGRDGFYFVKLNYSPQAAEMFAAEDVARRQPVSETIMLDGQVVDVLHSQYEAGQLSHLFDGDTFTLARTRVDNPTFVDLTFPQPRAVRGLKLTTGTMNHFNVTVKAYADGATEPRVYSQDFQGLPSDPTVDIPLEPEPITRLRIEVKDLAGPPDVKIHLREIQLVD